MTIPHFTMVEIYNNGEIMCDILFLQWLLVCGRKEGTYYHTFYYHIPQIMIKSFFQLRLKVFFIVVIVFSNIICGHNYELKRP